MCKKVINRTSASVDVLEPSTHHCQHRQPSVLDLLGPQLLELSRDTGSPTQRVEPLPTWVTNVCARQFVVWEDWVLVYHDLLGMMQHPHHAKVTPKFCKHPYKISSSDLDGFLSELQKLGSDKAASDAAASAEKMDHSDSPSSQ
ncbi:unnamed protein product [Arabidopsis thaliana]|uniref:(thale cress) hypothetical protein n=1 Tax=Arabidopsis thaliana TaxID=3702 RepID=A0A7G2EYF5_ARATH|nr:unnamed protein product [Arabidopsis thaliana]